MNAQSFIIAYYAFVFVITAWLIKEAIRCHLENRKLEKEWQEAYKTLYKMLSKENEKMEKSNDEQTD